MLAVSWAGAEQLCCTILTDLFSPEELLYIHLSFSLAAVIRHSRLFIRTYIHTIYPYLLATRRILHKPELPPRAVTDPRVLTSVSKVMPHPALSPANPRDRSTCRHSCHRPPVLLSTKDHPRSLSIRYLHVLDFFFFLSASYQTSRHNFQKRRTKNENHVHWSFV